MPGSRRLSAPASVAVDGGKTMLSQLEYQQVHGGSGSAASSRSSCCSHGLARRICRPLGRLLKRPSQVILHTDSQYVMKGITEWIKGWKVKGWRTADKKPVKNEDLWRKLDAEAVRHEIKWVWVKGHSGHNGNERADALANKGVESIS